MPAFVALPALVAPVVARVALVQALVLVPALMGIGADLSRLFRISGEDDPSSDGEPPLVRNVPAE